MNTQDETLRELTESVWFGVGWDTADAYSRNQQWLSRRVEAIEFVGRRSVKRSISVDFEVPKGLPSLTGLVAEDTVLVPISVLQKWPPLMDFELTDPDGNPLSLYLRTTARKLDFGLLLGMADRTLALGESKRGRATWEMRRKLARYYRLPRPQRLDPSLRARLASLIRDHFPSRTEVSEAVNELGKDLEARLRDALWRERHQGKDRIATEIAATIDLAARLAGSSILWVPVKGTPGTDRIIRFSYLSAYGASTTEPLEENGERARPTRRSRMGDRGKRVLIGCSWRQRTLQIPLLHAGRHVRYHLDVRASEGCVELVDIKAKAFPPATADADRQDASVRSSRGLARRYPESLDAPDEWVGPESGSLYMDYGPPISLASTPEPRRRFRRRRRSRENPSEGDRDSIAEIVDRRAHVYLGAKGAPSHRVFLQVKLAAPRQGFIQGCLISAVVISALMWATYLTLTSVALHLDATAVLLSVVPVVLGYVLVRPGEQALERYHVTGVRTMALFSGAMPIIGALTLVLTHKAIHGSPPDLSVAEPIWLGLAIFSAIVASLLAASWFFAAPSKEPREGADISELMPFS